MRLIRVVMKSGANMDVAAMATLDDPAQENIYFFSDEEQRQLAATVYRPDVAGMIFTPRKSITASLPTKQR
jgi:hypothetical protein